MQLRNTNRRPNPINININITTPFKHVLNRLQYKNENRRHAKITDTIHSQLKLYTTTPLLPGQPITERKMIVIDLPFRLCAKEK
jgi:hypothetical protein